jgi:DNA repair protein RadA/Sms
VIDSIQTMHSDLIEGAPGTVSQVRASAQELIRFAKESGTALVLVGHVTKDGSIAGPRVLEHMVDTVLSFEGERSHQYRILRAAKNRFGGTDEIGVFAMGRRGWPRCQPVALFLTRAARRSAARRLPGAGGHAAGAGRDPGADRAAGERRDAAAGGGRLGQRAAGDDPGGAGGALRAQLLDGRSLSQRRRRLRVSDPAADLAVAAALVSALSERPVPAEAWCFGEVALSGELRPVAHARCGSRKRPSSASSGPGVPRGRRARDQGSPAFAAAAARRPGDSLSLASSATSALAARLSRTAP